MRRGRADDIPLTVTTTSRWRPCKHSRHRRCATAEQMITLSREISRRRPCERARPKLMRHGRRADDVRERDIEQTASMQDTRRCAAAAKRLAFWRGISRGRSYKHARRCAAATEQTCTQDARQCAAAMEQTPTQDARRCAAATEQTIILLREISRRRPCKHSRHKTYPP